MEKPIPKTFKIDGFTYKVRCVGTGQFLGLPEPREKWELVIKIGHAWMREAHCYLPVGSVEDDAKRRLAGV
jgi:hypothetical protein